jgi:hypothetical protein
MHIEAMELLRQVKGLCAGCWVKHHKQPGRYRKAWAEIVNSIHSKIDWLAGLACDLIQWISLGGQCEFFEAQRSLRAFGSKAA